MADSVQVQLNEGDRRVLTYARDYVNPGAQLVEVSESDIAALDAWIAHLYGGDPPGYSKGADLRKVIRAALDNGANALE